MRGVGHGHAYLALILHNVYAQIWGRWRFLLSSAHAAQNLCVYKCVSAASRCLLCGRVAAHAIALHGFRPANGSATARIHLL